MAEAAACTILTLVIEGIIYERLVFGIEERNGKYHFEFCPDCAVPRESLHHIGCDWEACPRCGNQLLGCYCDVAPVEKALTEEESRLQLQLLFASE